MSPTWKIAGINFDHFHMGDLLEMARRHPRVEIVGISDEQPARMQDAARACGLASDHVFTDYRACMEQTRPDLVILCPAATEHGLWTRCIAEYGTHIVMEKPFAGSLAEADDMIAAQAATGKLLAINWPLRWLPVSVTAKRLIDEGVVGDVLEYHHYGGNRGPLYHAAGKVELTPAAADKAASWFYSRARGGGSLLDYAGYGSTLGTWYQGGRAPIDVTCIVDEPAGLEVDEHSITICRYAHGLSKIETRWGTFTDPWVHQPTPACGFQIVGTEGTIAAFDYEKALRVQTRQNPAGELIPCDELRPPFQDPIQYLVHVLEGGDFLRDPLHPEISRIGQQIVDTAALSARERRTVALLEK